MSPRALVSLLCAPMLLSTACAGPSAAQREAQARTARLLMEAKAVHMPPAGTDSCVGVTLRLAQPDGKEEAARKALEGRITDDEAAGAIRAAGEARCKAAFRDGLSEAGVPPEPLEIQVAYGVDPEGKVCAVVERARSTVIDPVAGPLVDQAAACLKDTLFSARFPAERVEDKERVVRFHALTVAVETETATTATAR